MRMHLNNLENLYQFFCGLYLMVGMADVVNATLSKFEKMHHDTVDDGLDEAETEDDKKLSESIIVRCVCTVCKALSRGGDPKSGKHKEWHVHIAHQLAILSMSACSRHLKAIDLTLFFF